jgi:hypothetical protein
MYIASNHVIRYRIYMYIQFHFKSFLTILRKSLFIFGYFEDIK